MRTFEPAIKSDLTELSRLLSEAKIRMEQNGIRQWTTDYPNQQHILQDIENEELFLLKEDKRILCMGTLSQESFTDKGLQLSDKAWFIKRIITQANETGKGLGRQWLEAGAFELGSQAQKLYSCTNHSNWPMQRLFEKTNFNKVNEIILEERKHLGSFYIYERTVGASYEQSSCFR